MSTHISTKHSQITTYSRRIYKVDTSPFFHTGITVFPHFYTKSLNHHTITPVLHLVPKLAHHFPQASPYSHTHFYTEFPNHHRKLPFFFTDKKKIPYFYTVLPNHHTNSTVFPRMTPKMFPNHHRISTQFSTRGNRHTSTVTNPPHNFPQKYHHISTHICTKSLQTIMQNHWFSTEISFLQESSQITTNKSQLS